MAVDQHEVADAVHLHRSTARIRRGCGAHRFTAADLPGLPETGRSTSGPSVRCPRQASRTRRTRTVSGMGAGLLPLPTRCRTRCPHKVLR